MRTEGTELRFQGHSAHLASVKDQEEFARNLNLDSRSRFCNLKDYSFSMSLF